MQVFWQIVLIGKKKYYWSALLQKYPISKPDSEQTYLHLEKWSQIIADKTGTVAQRIIVKKKFITLPLVNVYIKQQLSAHTANKTEAQKQWFKCNWNIEVPKLPSTRIFQKKYTVAHRIVQNASSN